MTTPDVSVVCVNDDGDERERTVTALTEDGFRVETAATVSAAESAIDESVDCVVTATDLPDGTGFDVVAAVRERHSDCPVVLFGDVSPADVPDTGRDHIVESLPRDLPAARDRLVSLVTDAGVGNYQVAYPIPEDESERLEALAAYDVAGRSARNAFERLTKLVASHFDIEVAFVGLVDEHEERFVACEGANWETLARENTICTHTILEDDLMVVEDVQADPRFAGNDRLVELNIRSYAGARLTTPDGHAIGALCCVNDEPRTYTSAELADLRLFADEAEELLELRTRLNERERVLDG